MKALILFLGVLFLTVSSHAAVITFNDISRDTSSNIVQAATLEWLKWDQTKNRNVDWFLNGGADSLEGGGWRLASTTEMASLLQDSFQFLTGQSLPENRTRTQDIPYELDDSFSDATYAFNQLFGTTRTRRENSGEPLISAIAIFGNDQDGDGDRNVINVQDDHRRGTGGINREPGQVRWNRARASILFTTEEHGLALVRSKATDVPAPGIVALFLLAFSVAGIRRTTRQR